MSFEAKYATETKRFVIAGGGTGGHIFPAIAIANAIKQLMPNASFLFVGAKGKMEMEKVPQAGYEIKGLTIAGFNRSSLIKNIGLPFKLVKSFFEVASIVRHFKPDAVIGVGGYSSFPVLRYAQSKGIPTFIHESNAFAGKSNQMLGKKATKIFTATDGMEKFFPANKILITGNPIRQMIANNQLTKAAALSFFGLNTDKKTVLCIGGSLGAKSINESVYNNIDQFDGHGLQLIWQTGKPFADKARQKAANRKNVFVQDFINQMDHAYAAADIVVSRSGAMAIAELSATGKPVIFVPYPHAAEDHQTFNARTLVEKNAAMMIVDSQAANQLMPAIMQLSLDQQRQQLYSNNIRLLGRTDADKMIANEILKSIVS